MNELQVAIVGVLAKSTIFQRSDLMMIDPVSPITAEQARTARKLIRKTPIQVCRDLRITPATLRKAETPRLSETSRYLGAKLKAYYETAGVEFMVGSLPGARLPAALLITQDQPPSTDGNVEHVSPVG